MKILKKNMAIALVVAVLGTSIGPHTVNMVKAAENDGTGLYIATASNAIAEDYEKATDSNAGTLITDIEDEDTVEDWEEDENILPVASSSNADSSLEVMSLTTNVNSKGQQVVYASNTEELVNAIESNTEIILEGKTYNLARMEDGIEKKDLDISTVENLTIKGQKGTRIVSDSGSDIIMRIAACKNLVIENVVIGHDLSQKPEFGCDENIGVIYASGSEITLNHCDIFGCGWMGISAYDCN